MFGKRWELRGGLEGLILLSFPWFSGEPNGGSIFYFILFYFFPVLVKYCVSAMIFVDVWVMVTDCDVYFWELSGVL